MKYHFTLMLATACLANVAIAADIGTKASQDAAEKRYAEDRRLCADEPSSGPRMQCLRDAKAEYDKAIKSAASAEAGSDKTCAACGRVLSVNVVEKDGEGSAVGMVAGGVVGGLLGNQVGKGTGRTIATVAGAAGGAYAGNKIEQKVKTVKKWVIAVRFDSGEEKTFNFDKDPGFTAGAAVMASNGSIIHR
jgi:outer membrane lipoprotein SlyB